MLLSPPEGFGIKMNNGNRTTSAGSAFAPKSNSLADRKKYAIFYSQTCMRYSEKLMVVFNLPWIAN